VLSVFAARPAVRAAAIAIYILLAEWSRALISTQPRAAMGALVLGGVALVVTAVGWPLERLGLGRSQFGFRILGGFALAAVLLLPAAVRASAVPILPAFLVLPAVVVAVGEEIAFRGALYAALTALTEAGVEIVPISLPTPAVLFGGQKVSFHHISGFGLIEILHTGPRT